MPKKNFDQPINDVNGKPFLLNNEEYTMRRGIIEVLASPQKWEDAHGNLRYPPDKKVAAGALAVKLYNGGEIDLTLDELKLIEDRVKDLAPPLTAYRVLTYLNQ